MGEHGRTWAARRGITPESPEAHAPWARLQEQLEHRYRLGLGLERRWERPDEDDPRNLPIFLRQASSALDADVARLAGVHAPRLSPTEVDTLRRLAAKPSAVVQLAEYLRVGSPRASRIADRLEGAGLVASEAPYSDLRKRRCSLTPEGHDLVAALDRDLDDLVRTWLDELDADAQAIAVRFIAALADTT